MMSVSIQEADKKLHGADISSLEKAMIIPGHWQWSYWSWFLMLNNQNEQDVNEKHTTDQWISVRILTSTPQKYLYACLFLQAFDRIWSTVKYIQPVWMLIDCKDI